MVFGGIYSPDTLPLHQLLRAWAKVRCFCLRLHHVGETYLVGYFPQLLLNQGHKLLSYFFEAAWFWLSASSFIRQIFVISLHYVRDWTFALEIHTSEQDRSGYLFSWSLWNLGLQRVSKGQEFILLLFNPEMISAGKEEDFKTILLSTISQLLFIVPSWPWKCLFANKSNINEWF